MSRDFPDWIDIDRAADAGRCFSGQARLEWMPRLLEFLDRPEEADTVVDNVAFEIVAGRDEQHAARLSVHVHGSVPLTCQRTLARYSHPIDSRSEIAPVTSEHQLAGLPEDLEAKLVPEGRLNLIELVEDELLLALPLVPRDPQSRPVECTRGEPVAPGDARDNPFAELKRLRGDDQD